MTLAALSIARSFASAFGLLGLTRTPTVVPAGASSCSSSSLFEISGTENRLTPVTLPVGRPRLATRPLSIGSEPLMKTIGMVVVAALAACAAGSRAAAMTAGRSRTTSSASAPRRS